MDKKHLFKDDDAHIKKMQEVQKFLSRQRDLSIEEQSRIAARAKKEVHSPSGMTKEEFTKVVRRLQMDPDAKVNPEEARRLRKLA